MKKLRLLIPIIVAALLLVSCCKGDSTVCDSCFHEVTNCSFGYILPVENGDNRANLYMQVKLTAGAIAWTVKDPTGYVQWEERCEAGDRLDLIAVREFSTPSAGDWHLELDLQDVIGEYKCVWKTQ